jgi:hypothetical protein
VRQLQDLLERANNNIDVANEYAVGWWKKLSFLTTRHAGSCQLISPRNPSPTVLCRKMEWIRIVCCRCCVERWRGLLHYLTGNINVLEFQYY